MNKNNKLLIAVAVAIPVIYLSSNSQVPQNQNSPISASAATSQTLMIGEQYIDQDKVITIKAVKNEDSSPRLVTPESGIKLRSLQDGLDYAYTLHPSTIVVNTIEKSDLKSENSKGTVYRLSEFNDILASGPGDDNIMTFEGNDVINTGNGNDFISAGPGDDEVHTGSGNDELIGEEGVDLLDGGTGQNRFVFRQGDGHDTLMSEGTELLDITTENDVTFETSPQNKDDLIIHYSNNDDILYKGYFLHPDHLKAIHVHNSLTNKDQILTSNNIHKI